MAQRPFNGLANMNLAVLDKNMHCTSLGVKFKVTEFFALGYLCTEGIGQMERV